MTGSHLLIRLEGWRALAGARTLKEEGDWMKNCQYRKKAKKTGFAHIIAKA